jgi:hypothetical protein
MDNVSCVMDKLFNIAEFVMLQINVYNVIRVLLYIEINVFYVKSLAVNNVIKKINVINVLQILY